MCSDNDFVRRVYLDVIGDLADHRGAGCVSRGPTPDRRQRLIDKLLDRPEHAHFWALKWGDLLRLQKSEVTEAGVHKFYQWLVDAFEKNMPFDQFARELLTAQGSTYDHPAANYYRALDDPIEAAETTAQLFLGSRIQCAKCHNHPFENWTQDNFYGLTAFFNRVSRKPGMRVDEEIVYVARDGEVLQPRTGQMMKPWLPGDGVLDDATLNDRRRAFRRLVDGARQSILRARRGEPDLGGGDGARHCRSGRRFPPIESAVDSGAARQACRGLRRNTATTRSNLCARFSTAAPTSSAARPTELNQDDTRFFSHAKMRMLSAEQLLDAICQVTEIKETFAGLPAGTPATEMPSPDFKHEFLDTFGRPARQHGLRVRTSYALDARPGD